MARGSRKSGSAQVRRLSDSLAREKEKRLDAERSLHASRAQQAAVNDILEVMQRSPADPQPVFEAIVRRALRLLGGHSAVLTQVSQGVLHLAAATSTNPAGDAVIRTRFPQPVSRHSIHGRAVLSRRPCVVPDTEKVRSTKWRIKETGKIRGFRSLLAVPLVRDREAIGSIAVTRKRAGAFDKRQVALLQAFASQAVMAIDNVRRFRETKEALEHQKASGDILRVISGSPTDLAPVMAAVAESAARLCEATDAHIWQREGEEMQLVASHGELSVRRPRLRIGRESVVGRAATDCQIVHVRDLAAVWQGEFPDSKAMAEGGYRTVLAVPLVREGASIGAILIRRREVRPFSHKQLALLQTFADQAVIAIENVRLFNETKEALERQTATAEILKVIGSSPTDAQPVFEAIVQSGLKLFPDAAVHVSRPNGNHVDLVAIAHRDPAVAAATKARFPIPLSHDYLHGAAILDARVIDLPDTELARDGPFAAGVANFIATGNRAMTIMPMLHGGKAVGTISVTRIAPGPLTDRQLALLRIFADQAVIAIENVRLFNELRERNEQLKQSLDFQAASGEILAAISNSVTDAKPVFEAIVDNVLRLFGTRYVSVFLLSGGELHLAAVKGDAVFGERVLAAASDYRASFPQPVDPDTLTGQALRSGKILQISPILGNPRATERAVALAKSFGYDAMVVAPLLREGEVIGAISTTHPEPRLFSEKELAVLKAFGEQAVIAIENVRLFNETKEALERQTATAEILKVISRSPTDVQPVFDAIVKSAAALFQPCDATIAMLEGGSLHWRATARAGVSEIDAERLKAVYPLPFDPDRSPSIRAILERRIVLIEDAAAPGTPEFTRRASQAAGFRSAVFVPLIRENEGVGSLVLTTPQAGFKLTDKQMALLQTFASQAIIAIENVRLFNELQQRTEALSRSVQQLTALGEVGQAISSTLDLETVLQTIVAHAVQLTGLDVGTIYEFDETKEQFELRASRNMPQQLLEIYRSMPIRLGEGIVGKSAAMREVVQIPDIQDAGYQSRYRDVLLRHGYRAILAVPLLREDRIIGAITVSRMKPGEFAAEVVELLKTFAAQSALAIQNARLFREIAEKSRQLEEASKHKSQFLASMSHELRTPLNAILGFNEMLLGEVYGPLSEDMQPPLAQMQTSGKHLLRLINNVLDLAKIEAGRMELALSDYSVHDTVESVRSTLRPLAEAKGLDFVVEMPTDLPLAHGDPGRITQCLMNLAGNSLKFTKAGKVAISVAERDGLLVYRVVDTGIGIPADKIGSLFTEFKQTDATIANEFGGTGLGLSISRKFVEMHGGRIWAESEPGQGSTFIFEIPLRAGKERTA